MTEINSPPDGAASHRDNRHSQLTTEELKIIQYFAQGQKHSLSSQNLKLEYTDTSIRLTDSQGNLLGISKQVNQWQRKVLLTNSSIYRMTLLEALVELDFIVKQKSSHPEFTEHHHYRIPEGYKLNYTEVIQLWKVWWNNKRYQLNNPSPPIDVLTFMKGGWHLIQDLQPKQGNFIILTERGEMKIEPEEYVVWIDLISVVTNKSNLFNPFESSTIKQQQTLSLTPSMSLDPHPIGGDNTATEVDSSSLQSGRDASQQIGDSEVTNDTRSVENSEQNSPSDDEYVDLESYLSTFNTEDTEDVDRIEGIYNIDELLSGNAIGSDLPAPSEQKSSVEPLPQAINLPPQSAISVTVDAVSPEPAMAAPAPTKSALSISQRQASLKRKALTVLATYLKHGDIITHTEVLKNAQGQEMNRKIVKIHRGCPSWAIEQIWQLDRSGL